MQNLQGLDLYVSDYPSPTLAVDLFKGEWSSKLPGLPDNASGSSPLFDDPRVSFWVKSIESVFPQSFIDPTAFKVLELGPLEGGHTYQLSKKSWQILSIENNVRAFMRCLLVANMYNMRARFMLGNFEEFLIDSPSPDIYDFVLASGVLYHLKKPTETLRRLLKITKSIGIWSHYASPSFMATQPGRWEMVEYLDSFSGKVVKGFKQNYGEALELSSYCGGSAPFSVWMTQEQILGILKESGFTVNISNDERESPSGPNITLFAYR